MDNQYQQNQNIDTRQSWFKPKYLLYAFIVAVVIEIIWAGKILLTPIPQKQVNPPPAITDASLTLLSASKSYKVGDSIPVDINLSTGGHKTVGTDIVLKYNPKVLEASQAAFTQGTIYSDYPLIKVDNAEGLVNVSGVITNMDSNFTGTGLFGQITFKAKSAGLAIIQLEFVKDSSNDSNVIETGTPKDVLGKVDNLEVNIR